MEKRGRVQGKQRSLIKEKRKENILGLLVMKSAKVAWEWFKWNIQIVKIKNKALNNKIQIY